MFTFLLVVRYVIINSPSITIFRRKHTKSRFSLLTTQIPLLVSSHFYFKFKVDLCNSNIVDQSAGWPLYRFYFRNLFPRIFLPPFEISYTVIFFSFHFWLVWITYGPSIIEVTLWARIPTCETEKKRMTIVIQLGYNQNHTRTIRRMNFLTHVAHGITFIRLCYYPPRRDCYPRYSLTL